MAATNCKTSVGESRDFKKMVVISGVGTKSIFEGAFPYSGLLKFRAVAEPRNSGISAKSREIDKNT